MSALKEVISAATEEFVTAILSALRGASFDEIAEISDDEPALPSAGSGGYRPHSAKKAAKASGGKGKRVRRTQDDIQGVVERIVSFVKKHKDGVSAEAIREELGVERKELPRPIAEALGQKLISKRGHKRATTYFAGSKTSAAKKSVKKKASKPKAKAASKKIGKKIAKKSAKKSGKKLSPKKTGHKKLNGASKKPAVAVVSAAATPAE
jgi:hypothetical protein